MKASPSSSFDRYSDDPRVLLERDPKEGFRWLYEKYSGFVKSIAYKILEDWAEAEDISQEIFLSISRKIDQFDPEKATFDTWVSSITRNRGRDVLRKRKISPEGYKEEEDLLLESASREIGADEILLQKQRKEQIMKLLNELTPHQRMLFLLKHVEGLSYEEIGERMKIPIGTVKTQLYRAKKYLETLARN